VTDPTLITTIEDNESEGTDGSNSNVRELVELRDSLMNGMQRNVRAPKGFFGMRGKKDFDPREQRSLLNAQLNALRERNRFVETPEEFYSVQGLVPKRAPSQGFFGMRGKKFGDYDLGGGLSDKRAPKGFVGLRGKKSGQDNLDDEEMDEPQVYDYNYNNLYEKRAPMGFTGVRGKKASLYR